MTEGPPTSGSGAEPGQQPPEPAQPQVPAGWYPHPTAPGWEAYWNGTGWGTETRPAQAPSTAPAAPASEAQTEAQPAVGHTQGAATEQPAAQATPAAATAAPAATTPAAATPAAPAAKSRDRSDSALPAILCVLGALVAIVGSFLPEVKLDVGGISVDLVDNTMVAAGYGIAVIAAAVIGAAIAVWAYLKGAGTWLPILLGAVIVGIAVYAGTAGLDVTPDFGTLGGAAEAEGATPALDDSGDPSTGIFAVGIGGLLMVLGGIGVFRANR